MIPNTVDNYDIPALQDYQLQPSYTYRLDEVNKRIIGKVDGQEAIIQFIGKVFEIEKYAYDIYDWYYGNELDTLIGQSFSFAEAEIPRIIQETLLSDDRITAIMDFTFTRIDMESLQVDFYVDTVYGLLNYTMVVNI